MARSGYSPKFEFPEKKEGVSGWEKAVMVVSSVLMIVTMVVFLVVTWQEPEAYASEDEPFESVFDIQGEPILTPDEEDGPQVAGQDVPEEPEPSESVSETVYVDQEVEADQDLGYPEVYWEEPVQEILWVQPADGDDLRYDGVQYDDDGTRYTWYSENVLPGGGLDIPGRHVGDEGYVMDGNGNLCVASSDHEKGTVLETPYGTAVVYDTGCPSGTVDMYTSW